MEALIKKKKIDTSKFKLVGKGGYGRVYDLNDGYVLKVSTEEIDNLKDSSFCNELKMYNILSKTEAKKIIPEIKKFRYYKEDRNDNITTYIITQKLQKLGHDYFVKLLKKYNESYVGYFIKKNIMDFFIKILDNFEILHHAGIVHLDGRLDNMMISKKGDIYFIDFGLSEDLNKDLLDMNSLIVSDIKDALKRYATGKNLSVDYQLEILRCILRIYDIWYFYTDFIRVLDTFIEDHKIYRDIIKKRIDKILKETGCTNYKEAIMEIIEIKLELDIKTAKDINDFHYYVSLFKYHIDLDKPKI